MMKNVSAMTGVFLSPGFHLVELLHEPDILDWACRRTRMRSLQFGHG
jgi:putative intracellular protease/amidase